MRPYSLDDYWEGVAYRFQSRGRRLPWRWRAFYGVAVAILRWGARGR